MESMGFKFIGRSHLSGEHYNFYGDRRQSQGPKFILNYNRKTGGTVLTKCLDELTIDGLLSKIENIERRTSLIDVIGYIIATGLIAICAIAMLKAFGINLFV